MGPYVTRRLLVAVPTLVVLSVLTFGLTASAGDPAVLLARRLAVGGDPTPEQIERVRHELGMDRPLPVRYVSWLGDAAQGDLGVSLFSGRDVWDEVRSRVPATMALAGAAMVLIVCLSVPLGVAGALLHRRWPDHVLRVLALAGASVPGFFLGYVLIQLFAVHLGMFPVAGLHGLPSLVLPALALAVAPTALVSRLLRSSLLEVLGEEYIRTARAKGLAWVSVVLDHAFRNATLPATTVLGSVFARLLEGAVIIETIFAWPGVGRLAFDAITRLDYPVIQGTVLLAGMTVVVVNLVVDLSYSVLDPRVRLGVAS